MQGFVVLSFLYDTIRNLGPTIQATGVMIPLNDSRSSLDVRMKAAIDLETAEGRKRGWTLVSHAATLMPKLIGEDANKRPFFLFEVTGAKGTERRCEAQMAVAFPDGLEPDPPKRISNALALMAQLSKGKGYRPVGHTVTYVVS